MGNGSGFERRFPAHTVVISTYDKPYDDIVDYFAGAPYRAHLVGHVNRPDTIQASVHSATRVTRDVVDQPPR